ncbi:MAG: hypothetical protein R3338_11550, partial [Thermoanaerobaculia bacterium]|nr:hypothetical protein [Thermoanaerobaculia bacterium]
MKFVVRYPIWIILPPLLIGGPLGFLFLTQVVQMTLGRWFLIVGIGALAYVPITFVYWRRLARLSREVTRATGTGRPKEVSDAISECLLETEKGAMIFWPVAGAVLSAVIGIVMTPSLRSASYFVESSLIVSTIAMAWTYWAGKRT